MRRRMTQRHLAMRRSRTNPNSSQALWPGMQVGATLRITSSHLLGVGLDQASASIRYRGQRRGNPGPRHALAAGSGAGEQAADPPVRRLGRWPVLTPAHAPAVTIDEHLVDGAVGHVSEFGLAVARHGAVPADALGMKADAPAATPDTVVRLNQCGEVIPGIGREQPCRVRGHSRCHSPTLLPPWAWPRTRVAVQTRAASFTWTDRGHWPSLNRSGSF